MPNIEISREDLVGCWKTITPPAGYIQLLEDGTVRRMLVSKTMSGDLDLNIFWRHIEPNGLEITAYRFDESEPYTVHEYQAKYFKGKTLEWWEIRFNDRVIEDVKLSQPICWQRSKVPTSWK